MDWKQLGKEIINLGAPLLGTALGGPAGGAVGVLLANTFGVAPDDPAAIARAIEADPDAGAKVMELQFRHKERLEEIQLEHAKVEVQRELGVVTQTNLTMRAEAQSEHWAQWMWRPTWGFVSAAAFLVVCVFVCILAYKAVIKADQNALTMIPLMVAAFTTLFGIPGAILGITAWGRNKIKQAQVLAG